jgi:hypothetical protein
MSEGSISFQLITTNLIPFKWRFRAFDAAGESVLRKALTGESCDTAFNQPAAPWRR